MSYCTYCKTLPNENHHRIYHDFHYGFPIDDDNELFGRLILEINQAGLSWDLILKKQDNFRNAFDNFEIEKIATYSNKKVEELVLDAGIIRNRLKINAVIYNAKVIIELQKEFKSFKNWIEFHQPKLKEEWVELFKKTFKFTGGEIVKEFLMSTGYLNGAHDDDCEILIKINNAKS